MSDESESESLRKLVREVLSRLTGADETLAIAESCTGGWLGCEITAVSGASDAFWGGVIAYADDAKCRLLSVAPETLRSAGSVSEGTAREMAAGVRKLARATWGLGITGLAGPSGGTESKPVGTVYVAVAGRLEPCRKYRFSGGRRAVRHESVAAALRLLRETMDAAV